MTAASSSASSRMRSHGVQQLATLERRCRAPHARRLARRRDRRVDLLVGGQRDRREHLGARSRRRVARRRRRRELAADQQLHFFSHGTTVLRNRLFEGEAVSGSRWLFSATRRPAARAALGFRDTADEPPRSAQHAPAREVGWSVQSGRSMCAGARGAGRAASSPRCGRGCSRRRRRARAEPGSNHSLASTGERPNSRATFSIRRDLAVRHGRGSAARRQPTRAHVDQRQHRRRRRVRQNA